MILYLDHSGFELFLKKLINCFYKIYTGYSEAVYYLGYYTKYIFKESFLLMN